MTGKQILLRKVLTCEDETSIKVKKGTKFYKQYLKAIGKKLIAIYCLLTELQKEGTLELMKLKSKCLVNLCRNILCYTN